MNESAHPFARAAPQSVQAVRGLTEAQLRSAASAVGDQFAAIDCADARDKADVLARIAKALAFPKHFGGNLDALYDSLTELPSAAGKGWAILLHRLPVQPGFSAEDREALLDTFRDAAEFHAEGATAFRVFFSYA